MKIAVIGAGWYGCHISLSLIQKGIEVDIFEKASSTISAASKKNQNRLHLGFHYPRDSITRNQSREGFDWFVEHYPHLIRDIPNNFYSVANEKSYIDSDTYEIIMKGSGLDFEKKELTSFTQAKFENIGPLLLCNEKVIRNDLASAFFNDILSKHLRFNTFVDLNNDLVRKTLEDKYDYIIDCTWGRAQVIKDIDYYFEPCIYFYYDKKDDKHFALTVMDGMHYSLYPYYDQTYTLTSVEHTPLGQFNSLNESLSALAGAKANRNLIKDKRVFFEKEFSKIYPNFLNDFEYKDVEFSLKTKIKSSTDFRGCLVKKVGKVISVFSGKIDTLHIAEREVSKVIHGGLDES